MRILITGAAGKVGRALRKELASEGHQLVLADVKPIPDAESKSLVLDIADGKAVCRAMKGIDAVAHLAMGRFHHRHPIRHIASQFDVNAKGTFNLLHAAAEAKVKRFVYTSTLSVFGHTLDLGKRYWTERSRPQPLEEYGLTKYFGEEACRLFAAHRGLSVVCLRLCNVVDETRWRKYLKRKPRTPWERYWIVMATRAEDVARAIHRALVVPGLRYEIIHVASDNTGRLTSIHRAKQVLGFRPRHKLR